MLIHLMENYIRNEKQNMETDDSLNELIVNISKRNRTSIKKELKKMIVGKKDGGLMEAIKKVDAEKEKGFKDGDLVDVSRGQAGYNFKGIY